MDKLIKKSAKSYLPVSSTSATPVDTSTAPAIATAGTAQDTTGIAASPTTGGCTQEIIIMSSTPVPPFTSPTETTDLTRTEQESRSHKRSASHDDPLPSKKPRRVVDDDDDESQPVNPPLSYVSPDHRRLPARMSITDDQEAPASPNDLHADIEMSGDDEAGSPAAGPASERPASSRWDIGPPLPTASDGSECQDQENNELPCGGDDSSNPHPADATPMPECPVTEFPVTGLTVTELTLTELPLPESMAPPAQPFPTTQQPAPCRFQKLPEAIQARIFSLLLVADQPIRIDFNWLQAVVRDRIRVPKSHGAAWSRQSVEYKIPITPAELQDGLRRMQDVSGSLLNTLRGRAFRGSQYHLPCRGLTTSLLRVSRDTNRLAARIFYGQNAFHFPSPVSAWIQLDMFLSTIQSTNISHLRRLQLHAPLWHLGPHEDFLTGAILDLVAPASRMRVVAERAGADDRLLAAITHSARRLVAADALEALALDVELGAIADRWAGRAVDPRRLFNYAEAEALVVRKRTGTAWIHWLGGALEASEGGAGRPVLTLYSPLCAYNPSLALLSDFCDTLPAVMAEAEKYGCRVSPALGLARLQEL